MYVKRYSQHITRSKHDSTYSALRWLTSLSWTTEDVYGTGLSDGHTLTDCPYRCEFCGNLVNICECPDSSLVSGLLDSENPVKDGRKKHKASIDDG